jgi:hypothetical protein
MPYERRRTLPMRMTCTVVARVADGATFERRTKRLRQSTKDLNAELRALALGAALRLAGSAARPSTPARSSRPARRDMHRRANLSLQRRHAGDRNGKIFRSLTV